MFTNYEQVMELLTELGRRLAEQEIEAEIYLVGGGAMLLGYDRRVVTKDLDGAYLPIEAVEAVADQMYLENNRLLKGWLNNQVVPILPRIKDPEAWEALNIPGLTVTVASPRHLLAMKARAGRTQRDFEDVAVLASILDIRSVAEIWEVCAEVWGGDMIRPDLKSEIEDFLVLRGFYPDGE